MLCEAGGPGYAIAMKAFSRAAALVVAKKLYEQARKPENQAKLRSAIEKARASGGSRK